MKLIFEKSIEKDYMGRWKWFATGRAEVYTVGKKFEVREGVLSKHVIYTDDNKIFKLNVYWSFSQISEPKFNSLEAAIQAANEIEEMGNIKAFQKYEKDWIEYCEKMKTTYKKLKL